jgi:long-chain acyl-CoA synthetase
MIFNSSSKYANKIALEDYLNTPISRLTYGRLYENIIKFGKSLIKTGINERDHIALIGENRVQWGISYLTAMIFNFVIVPVDRSLSQNDIINILIESDSKALIFSGSLQTMICEMKHRLTGIKYFISMDLQEDKGDFFSMIGMIGKENNLMEKLPEINPGELAEIIYTSGSLGRAKGVMLTQKGIAANIMGMTSMIKIFPEDRFAGILPMHHTYQCTCGFLCPLFSGASVHFIRSIKTILEDIKNSKATIMLGAPLLYNKLYTKILKNISEKNINKIISAVLIRITNLFGIIGWKNCKKIVFRKLHNIFGGSMRLMIVGGAAPDPKVSKFFRNLGFNFVQGYGLTETSPILTLNTIKYFKDEAAGIPLPGVTIKIDRPDKYGIGEVYAKGDNIMLGYYKNEKISSASFDEGWFKTGDLGFLDSTGFLHLSGRKKNVIIANNGENVYPEEIEDLLNRSPFILESLVYGERSEKHDEIIAAQIVTDSEAFADFTETNKLKLTEEVAYNIIAETIKDINKCLPSYKQIKRFYLRDKEFEKTTTQKIKRHSVCLKN